MLLLRLVKLRVSAPKARNATAWASGSGGTSCSFLALKARCGRRAITAKFCRHFLFRAFRAPNSRTRTWALPQGLCDQEPSAESAKWNLIRANRPALHMTNFHRPGSHLQRSSNRSLAILGRWPRLLHFAPLALSIEKYLEFDEQECYWIRSGPNSCGRCASLKSNNELVKNYDG